MQCPVRGQCKLSQWYDCYYYTKGYVMGNKMSQGDENKNDDICDIRMSFICIHLYYELWIVIVCRTLDALYKIYLHSMKREMRQHQQNDNLKIKNQK